MFATFSVACDDVQRNTCTPSQRNINPVNGMVPDGSSSMDLRCRVSSDSFLDI